MNRDPAVHFFTRLRRRSADARGFALTEAIAAAAVLAFLALGVLAGLDGAASSTGREKARSVASALAEKDQERLHAKRAVDLPDLRETEDVTVGGTKYTVTSEADWISDSTGGTLSCTSNGGRADYLRLRSTVTSGTVGKRTIPVKIESIVAPPLSASGGNTGTLAVQLRDRDDIGRQGIMVHIEGANTGYEADEQTNEVGCAIFALAPADSYDAKVDTPSYVDPSGEQEVHTNAQVNAGSTTLTQIVYDRAGEMKTGFDTTWWDPRPAAAGGARTTKSSAWWLGAENSGVPAGGIRRYQDEVGAVEPQMTLTATKLFPFKDGYGVHSGYCVETNPTKFDATWATTNAFQLIDPAQTYDRTTAPAKPLRQPALPLRIAYGKLPNPNSTKPNYVGGANVVAKLIPPSTQSQCKDTELVPGITMDANYGLQSYPTNVAATTTFPGSGTSPLFATGLAGMVTKKPTATNGFDPGLPFGRWQVCADYKDGSSSRKRIFTTIDNKHTGTAPTIYDLDVNAGAVGSCPSTPTSGWPATS